MLWCSDTAILLQVALCESSLGLCARSIRSLSQAYHREYIIWETHYHAPVFQEINFHVWWHAFIFSSFLSIILLFLLRAFYATSKIKNTYMHWRESCHDVASHRYKVWPPLTNSRHFLNIQGWRNSDFFFSKKNQFWSTLEQKLHILECHGRKFHVLEQSEAGNGKFPVR